MIMGNQRTYHFVNRKSELETQQEMLTCPSLPAQR